MGETIPRLTSGQLQTQSNGTRKYRRDDGPAQEASIKIQYLHLMISGRETEYSSKIAIPLEYPHLVQIMEPQIVSECLRFVLQSSSPPKPREQIWSRNSWDHPTYSAAVFICLSVQVIYWYKPHAEHTPTRRPLSAGGHTRRGPLAGAGGILKSNYYMKWSTVGRHNTAWY